MSQSPSTQSTLYFQLDSFHQPSNHAEISTRQQASPPPTPETTTSSLDLSSIDTLRPLIPPTNPNHSYFQASSSHPNNLATSTPQTTLDEERWHELRSPTTGMIVPEELSAGMVDDTSDADGIEETVARVAMEEQREERERAMRERHANSRMVPFDHDRHDTTRHDPSSLSSEFIPESHAGSSPLRPPDPAPDPTEETLPQRHHASSVHFTLPMTSIRHSSPSSSPDHHTPPTQPIDIVASSTLDERFPHLPAWELYAQDQGRDGGGDSQSELLATMMVGQSNDVVPEQSQDVDVEITAPTTATRASPIPSPSSSPPVATNLWYDDSSSHTDRMSQVPEDRPSDEPLPITTISGTTSPTGADDHFPTDFPPMVTNPSILRMQPENLISSPLSDWREAESDAVRMGDSSNRERLVITVNRTHSPTNSSRSDFVTSDTEDEDYMNDYETPGVGTATNERIQVDVARYAPPPSMRAAMRSRTLDRYTIEPGYDVQGINWEHCPVARATIIQARLRMFRNYMNRAEFPDGYINNKASLLNEVKKVKELGDYSLRKHDSNASDQTQAKEPGWFEWNRTRASNVRIAHFQLRHLTARIGGAGSGGALLFTAAGHEVDHAAKVCMWRDKITPIIDVDAAGRDGTTSKGIPRNFKNMHITTLAAKRDIVMTGGFHGEFVVKGLTNRTMEEWELEQRCDNEDKGEKDDDQDVDLDVSADHGDASTRRPLSRRHSVTSDRPPSLRKSRARLRQRAPLTIGPSRRRYPDTRRTENWSWIVGRNKKYSIMTHLFNLRMDDVRGRKGEMARDWVWPYTMPEIEGEGMGEIGTGWERYVDVDDEKWLQYSKRQKLAMSRKARPYIVSPSRINECIRTGVTNRTVATYHGSDDTTMCGHITSTHNGITNHIVLSNLLSGCTSAIVSSNDNKVRVMDLNDCRVVKEFGFAWPVNCTSLDPRSRLLAVVGDSTETLLLDTTTGKVALQLKGHVDYSFACAFSPDGVTLATGNQDLTARLYDLRNPSTTSHTTLGCKHGCVRSLHFSPCGNYLSMAEPWDYVHIFSVKEKYEKAQVIDFIGEPAGVSWSADDEPGEQGLWVANGERELTSVMEWQKGRRGGAKAVENLLI